MIIAMLSISTFIITFIITVKDIVVRDHMRNSNLNNDSEIQPEE